MTKQPPTVGDIWAYDDEEYYLVLEYIKRDPLNRHGADTVSMLNLENGRIHNGYPVTNMCAWREWRQVA